VHAALLDNFATDRAIYALIDLVKECNKYLEAASANNVPPKSLLIKKVALYVTKILRVFAVCDGTEEIGFSDSGASKSAEDAVTPFVEAFVDFRDTVRTAAKKSGASGKELLDACDEVRDTTLAALGVRVEDSGDAKALWKMDDPAAIAKEVAEKREKQAEEAAKKRENKIAQIEKDLLKAQTAAVPPTHFFREQQSDKWGSFDDVTGLPLTTTAGEPLSKSQQKTNAKILKEQEKQYEKVIKAAGGSADKIDEYVATLQATLKELKDERSS